MGAAPPKKYASKPELFAKVNEQQMQQQSCEPSKIDTVNVSLSTGVQKYPKVDRTVSPRASKDVASCETTKSGTNINYNVFTCTSTR